MLTQQTQIKLNLPEQLKDYVASRASRFGMPVASYVRYLIVKDVEDMEYPVYKASDRTEKAYKEAIQEKNRAKIAIVKGNISDFLDGV